MPNYPASMFHIWRDTLHRLRSYCWETARRSSPCRKNYAWIEKWLTPF